MNTNLHVVRSIETEEVEISPADAEAILANQAINRKVDRSTVAKYASDMLAGRWLLAAPLMFDDAGKLIDGQHRLRAVVAGGIAVRFLVLRGFGRVVQEVIDTGRVRRASTFFELDQLPNATLLAGVARLLEATDGAPDRFTDGTNRTVVTNGGILARGRSDELLQRVVAEVAGPLRTAGKLCGSPANVGWLVYRLRKHAANQDKAWHFTSQLAGAEVAPAGSPVQVWWQNVTRAVGSTRPLSPHVRLRLLVRTWNAFQAGRTVSKLQRGRTTEFPPIQGLVLPVASKAAASEAAP